MSPIAFPARRTAVARRTCPEMIRIAEHSGVSVVTIRGGIDVASAPVIRDVLGWAVEHHDRVVVHCADVENIDRDGLGLLIAMQDRAQQRDVELRFTALSSELMAALRQLNAETPAPGQGTESPGLIA